MTQETTSYNLNGMGIPYHIHNGVDSPMISPQSIGTGKIFNDISSSNYLAGVAGWKLSWGGDLEANSVTLTGGTIKYGKTSFTDSTHAGYYISSSGMYFGSASDAAYLKYTIATGALAVYGGTITGATVRTADPTGGGGSDAIVLDSTGTYANYIRFYDSGTETGRMFGFGSGVSLLNIQAIGTGSGITISNSVDGLIMTLIHSGVSSVSFFPEATNSCVLGSSTYRWNSLSLYNQIDFGYSGSQITLLGDIALSFNSTEIICAEHFTPNSDSTFDLGGSSYCWRKLYVDSIALNGDTKSAWPAAGTTVLSGLTIDVGKAWGGYNITALGNITPNGSLTYSVGSSSYYWEYVYLHIMEFWSYSTDPSTRTYGDMWHHYESGAGPKNFRGCPWNTDIYTFDMTVV